MRIGDFRHNDEGITIDLAARTFTLTVKTELGPCEVILIYGRSDLIKFEVIGRYSSLIIGGGMSIGYRTDKPLEDFLIPSGDWEYEDL